MLSKKFRLRKLSNIITTSVLMGACLIFGQSQDASATGFKGVNSGGAGRGRGTGATGPLSNSGVSGVRSSTSSGLPSSSGVRSSTSSGLPSSSGVKSSTPSSSGNDRRVKLISKIFNSADNQDPYYDLCQKLVSEEFADNVKVLGKDRVLSIYELYDRQIKILTGKDNGILSIDLDNKELPSGSGLSSSVSPGIDKVRVRKLFDTIEANVKNGLPDSKPYQDLLKETPDYFGETGDGNLFYKYVLPDKRSVEIIVDSERGGLKSASINMDIGEFSSNVKGANGSASSASRVASLSEDKGKLLLFRNIKDDISKEDGFPNSEIYKELLKYSPDSISDLESDGLQYKYRLTGGGEVEILVDPSNGNVKSAFVDINGKSGFINFYEGWFQTN